MTVYTWLVVLLLAASFLFKGNRKHNKKFIIIAFLLLFAVMGLRDVNAFGMDAWGLYGSYPRIYNEAGNIEWNVLLTAEIANYNIAFTVFIKIIYIITGGNYQWLITIISLIVMFSYMRFVGKYSTSPIQSILCFLGLLNYTFLFDALKQALAMAVLLFAFDAIIEKRPIKFILLTVLASLFHFPAIVFLPAYWIGRMRVGRNYLVLLAGLLLLTYVFRDQLLRLMINAYKEGESAASMEGVGFLRNKAIIMIAFVVFAVLIRPPERNDTLYNVLLMFSGVAIIFQTFCGYNNIFERLADYYFHTSIVFIPMIFEKKDDLKSRNGVITNEQILNYMMLLICAFAIWRFLSTMNNSAVFSNYKFFWQQ